MVKFEDIQTIHSSSRLDKYKEYKDKLVGHVVELPLHFL